MSLSKRIEDLDFAILRFLFSNWRKAIFELSSFLFKILIISFSDLDDFKFKIDGSEFPSELKTTISQI